METRTEQHGNVEVGTVTHNGKGYSAMGSCVDELYCTAYLGKDGQLTKWDGTVIGRWAAVTSWPTPNSYVSSHMYQVEVWIGGALYTGRSAGEGMLFKGKRVARQRKQLGASDKPEHKGTVLP